VHAFAAAAAAAFQVYKLPEPCTDAFLLQVSTWQHTRESEDLEAERREYYGSGGGSPFGARVSGYECVRYQIINLSMLQL
jgi:hypothetical protein